MENNKIYYKVLLNGKSCHGGEFIWSLPQIVNGEIVPGEWQEVTGDLKLCQHGFHLTDAPVKWWQPGASVFAVEISGDFLKDHTDKICARKVRLLREITDLSPFQSFTTGEHQVNSGFYFADGNAKVHASDNATIHAFGKAKVRAFDNTTIHASYNAKVTACGNAKVTACGNAKVEASDNATVAAYNNAVVLAFGNAKVTACDDATIVAYDNATIEASGKSVVVSCYGNPIIHLNENAVLFDQRGK